MNAKARKALYTALVVISIAVGSLTACNPGGTIDKAADQLAGDYQKNPYHFGSDDKAINSAACNGRLGRDCK